VREAADRGAAALRAYPQLWGLGAGDPRLDRLLAAAGEAGLPLVLVTRFEDLRQRHPLDTAPDLSAAHVRALARAGARTPIVVLNAGRDFIEEVAWALTPDEVARLYFDFSWVWGPPDDHLATLLRTLGPARFVAGSGWPLRLTQNTASLLDLLPDDVAEPALTGGDAIAAAAGALSGRVR
jgi:predicted TIM-barrel fold metal-dependent hydrolase